MALTAEQDQFIAKVGGIAHKLLELQSDMMVVNTLWNGSPNWDELITNQDIQDMPALVEAGLTHQTVGDAIYTIEVIRQAVLSGNLSQLVLLAQLK